MYDLEKVILTDCDGVFLNWEYAFITWMNQHGYEEVQTIGTAQYDVSKRFGISREKSKELVKFFNESAAIGFLPPLRDAMYYVDLLHRKHGYQFHMITSLSLDKNAHQLRINNIKKLFGETAFSEYIFLDTGEDKDRILSQYEGTNYLWIEDKVENAICGAKFGLESVLMEHGHNMDNTEFPLMVNWKELYEYITGISA